MGCCSSQNAVQENNNQEEENKLNEDENSDKLDLEKKSQGEGGEEGVEELQKENSNKEEEKVEEDIQEEINMYQLENDRVDYNQKSYENDASIGVNSQEVSNSANLRSGKYTNKNKTKKNLGKKRPFIISEFESSPYKKVKILINACSFCEEYMMPIWCPKDVYIKFRVKGKWRIDKNYEFTDSKGFPSNSGLGFNYGAMVGRIGLGDKFLVEDEAAILVKKEGPLFMRQNLPKRIRLEPEGQLEITVYDGEYMKIEEINERIGWKESGVFNNDKESSKNNENSSDINVAESNGSIKIKKNNKNNSIKDVQELEKKMRIYLNNLRLNPSLFYEKYINFNQSLIWTKKYLDKIKANEITALEENETCYNYLTEYFELPSQKKFLYKNNLSEYLSKVDEDVGFFLCEQVSKVVKVKSKITQKDNPYEIIVQFLLDKKYRSYIFDENSLFLTIKFFKNFFNNSSLVIMAIGIDRDFSLNEV
mgnify:CR=1 FL=1